MHEESKTSVAASVTCEWRTGKLRAMSSMGDLRLHISPSHAHDPPRAGLAFFLTDF